MCVRFTRLEWEIADQAYAEVHAEAVRSGGLVTEEAVADRIGMLNREARRADMWRKRALAAEATLRDAGIEPLPIGRAEARRAK